MPLQKHRARRLRKGLKRPFLLNGLMVKVKPVFDNPISIQYRGMYDYDGLISFLRKYLLNLKPNIYEEPKFKYKTGKTGAEVEFKFKATRKVTHYIQVVFEVSGHGFDVARKEVEINGKTQTLTGGKMEIQLDGAFHIDYPNMFSDEKKAEKWMDKVLNKEPSGLLFEDNKVTGKKFATNVLLDLTAKTKSFLKMECY